MADKAPSQESIEVGQRIQEKFDAYLLALIFTLLGLSIQTAKFGASPFADLAEVVSWLLLLVSGLAGLSRLESVPEFYRLHALQLEKEEAAHEARKARMQGVHDFRVLQTGSTVPVERYIVQQEEDVAKVKAALKPLEASNTTKYRLMKRAFAVGLVTLIVARAFVPVGGILRAWPWTWLWSH